MDLPRWMVVGFIPLSFLMMAIEFARFLWRRENFLAPLSDLTHLAMAWYWVATLLFGTALGLMMLGVPVAIGFLATNLLAAAFFMGGGPRHPAGDQQRLRRDDQLRAGADPDVPADGRALLSHRARRRCFNAADKLLGNVPRAPRLRHADRRHRVRRAGGLVDGRLRAARPADGAGDDPPRLQQVPVDRPDHGRRRPRGDHPALGAHRAARHARPDRRRRAADRRRHPGPDPRDDVRRADLGLDGDRPERRAGVRAPTSSPRARRSA